MLIFKQLLDPNGTVARAIGVQPGSCEFTTYCNDAVRQLMNRGEWWNTVVPMEGCVYNRCVTWPRGVGTVLALNEDGQRGRVFNKWYQFTPGLNNFNNGWNGYFGQRYHYPNWGMWGDLVTENNNTSPVFNPIQADGMSVEFFVSQPTDAGKLITIYGIDGNGQEIRTQRTDGTFQDGYTMTLAVPSVRTPFVVRQLTRVVKDETDGMINGFMWNPFINSFIDLCEYQPNETVPEYVVSRITGSRTFCDCNKIEKIKALVKLEFVPFKYPNDVVQIDNQDAIRDFILSIRAKEAKNIADSNALEVSALREMNAQLRTKMPDQSSPVMLRAFGTAPARRHMIGRYI